MKVLNEKKKNFTVCFFLIQIDYFCIKQNSKESMTVRYSRCTKSLKRNIEDIDIDDFEVKNQLLIIFSPTILLKFWISKKKILIFLTSILWMLLRSIWSEINYYMKGTVEYVFLNFLIMNVPLSDDHFQSSLLGGCNSTPTKRWWLEGQLTKVHS